MGSRIQDTALVERQFLGLHKALDFRAGVEFKYLNQNGPDLPRAIALSGERTCRSGGRYSMRHESAARHDRISDVVDGEVAAPRTWL